MKLPILLPLAACAALALVAPASAADAMKGMKMPAGAKMGHGTGVVTAVDANANTVTIKHGAIPAVGWPAMTMTFKTTPASLAKTVKPGDHVGFDLKVQGASNEVTAIHKQ